MKNIELRIDGGIYSYTTWLVKDFLTRNEGKPVTIRVNSPGGSIADGINISHLMAAHGDVTVIHDSLNASAATWLPFGAKNVKMYEDCMLYVHCSSQEYFMMQSMNAEQLKTLDIDINSDIKSLEAMDKMIAKKYADRCKKKKCSVDEMLKLMQSHPWLTSDECLEYGFVDEIIQDKMPVKVNQNVVSQFQNCKIPMPENFKVPDERNFIQSIVDGVVKTFKVQQKKEDTNFNQVIMNKKFVTVNTLLKIEGIDMKDDKIIMTDAQVKLIEDDLVQKQGKIENLGEQIKDLQQKLNDAENEKKKATDKLAAANATLDALSEDIKALPSIEDKTNKIKEIFDHASGTNLTPQTNGSEKDNYADCRKDPINFINLE